MFIFYVFEKYSSSEFSRLPYLISLAASKIAFIVEDDVQLNAGSATSLSLQYSINLSRLAPVTTPGGTIPCNPGIFGVVMFYSNFEV